MIAVVLAKLAGVGRLLPGRVWAGLAVAVLLILAVLWYGRSQYRAGEEAADARWELAAEKLVEQKREAALSADRAEAPRIEEHAAQMAEEKERIDAAIEAGDSPFDVLFPRRVQR